MNHPPGVLAPGSGSPHAPRQVATVRTRPAGWQPPIGTIDDVSAWLLGPARDTEKAPEAFDEFCWRVLGAGIAIARATLHVGTLDPQFFGYALIWWRELRRTEYILARHELRETAAFRDSPIALAFEQDITIRRRLEGNNVVLDYPVLPELRAQGITDYIVLPVRGGHGRRHVGSYATDRPGGFTSDDLAVLTHLAELMGILIDHFTLEQSARNVIQAYLGPKAGPRVLAGQIRRGSGERMRAVVWLSDIRGFTALSERLDGERVIAILNACFDAQATAIAAHGGEILKFMGDGILAIFPIADDAAMPEAAHAAAQAAQDGLRAVAALNGSALLAGEALRVVCALHAGEVFYGNIGAADRLDFTVIGPAVNLVSRTVEAAKALDIDLVVSDVFAAAHGDGPSATISRSPMLRSLGHHALRGLDGARELFTITAPTA